jgi:hypothetical protein
MCSVIAQRVKVIMSSAACDATIEMYAARSYQNCRPGDKDGIGNVGCRIDQPWTFEGVTKISTKLKPSNIRNGPP